jgi:AraC-like DNA-binding protein
MHGRSSGRVAPDSLSEVLQDLRLAEGSYGRCQLTRPWGIDLPPQSAARFHFVVSGSCWLQAPKTGGMHLHAGDVVLLPRGVGHTLTDAPKGRTRPLGDLPFQQVGERSFRLRTGGGGAPTLLACCSVTFAEPALHPLLELMPPVLLVRGGGTTDKVLPALLEAMADEVSAQRLGAATIMTRLADVIITRVIRAWVEARSEDTTGWLAAIRDPKIGRALAGIHRRPGHPWTVASLADVALTSRSMFSQRFTSVVGMPPARYLTRWRMHLASLWLRNERLTVSETAARLGYESEASFSRAFKRSRGVPPSALRGASPQS